MMNQFTDPETVDSAWKILYRVGGAAALIAAVLLPVEVVVFAVWGQPSTVVDAFALFHNNRLLGLLEFDLLGIVIYILLVPTQLALYAALRRTSTSFMAIGTIFFFVGIVVFFASNTNFCMLYLSDQYVAATTDAQMSMYLAAGQAMFTIFNVIAFGFSDVVVSAALLIVAAVMLRSNIFSRATAYAGILANVLAVGSITLFMPTIGGILSLISVVFLVMWYALIARRLFQLGRGVTREEVNQD